MDISDKTYAMLFVGQTVGAELPSLDNSHRSWVSVYPFTKEKNRIGVETEHEYRGVGSPIFHVLRFDIETHAVDNPTYDYDRYMSNVKRLDVTGDDFDSAIERLEVALKKWDIHPSTLGPLADDYPVI